MATENDFSHYAEMCLAGGRTFQYVARGQSMRPWIPDGASVVIGPMDTPEPGDIVLALTKKGPILHRLLGIDKRKAFLAGDLNSAIQECCVDELKGVALECTLDNGSRRPLRNSFLNRLMLLAFAPFRLRKRLKISLGSFRGPK